MQNQSGVEKQYAQASIATADNLRNIAHTLMAGDLSRLTLPEVNQAVDIVSEMVPAGNVPGVILNGLARIAGRRPPAQVVRRDIHLLFRGVSQVLDQAVYGALFAGPAAVIWGYQNLLKLAGKSPDDAFPEGTWQFYVDYALREDTARHTNETHGFDTLLRQHQIRISAIDRITAWVMTAIQVLHQYDDLLENEWRERVYTRVLQQMMADTPAASKFAKLYSGWEQKRPYGRRADAGRDLYPAYRRRIFDQYMEQALANLSEAQRQEWQQRISTLTAESLGAYQQQMTIISYLDPGDFGETRTSYPLQQAAIGLIHQGAYYLIPAATDSGQPPTIAAVRSQVAAILSGQIEAAPAHLAQLAVVRRASLAGLVKRLPPDTLASLQALRHAPIMIHADSQPVDLPLSQLRQTERGIGDHALTIFNTQKTFAFDQSHIYFDGAWGAALAEIMTNEALSWAQYLAALPQPTADPHGVQPVSIHWRPADEQSIRSLPVISTESAAESDQVNIKAILSLRKMFKQRSDLLQLTVNDLLVLYRAIHALTYQPSQELIAELEGLVKNRQTRVAAQEALGAIRTRENLAILIPVDASPYSPSERLYPMSFEVPLHELNLLDLHWQTVSALEEYNQSSGDRSSSYQHFDQLQRQYLATLAGFGAVLSRAKEIATSGESASVGSIKLLAHMPPALQRLLDGIPSRIDMLNDIIKGKEVFSNVGAVASTSTLTRFITAKDDNEKKTLAWGVITDAEGIMRISLRDFRPHVGMLMQAGQGDLARKMTRDYLDEYVMGLNTYIRDLRRITLASRETRIAPEPGNE